MKKFLTYIAGAFLLGWLAGPASAQNTAMQLGALLKDTHVEVRRAAAFALKFNLQSDQALANLIDAFKDSDEIVQANASDAIALMTPKVAVPPLTLALRATDVHVRINAARTLGRIRRYTDEAVPNLVFMLKDDSYDARQAAAEALKRIHSSTREY